MKMMFKLFLSVNLALCLLASSTLAMEENKRKGVPSRPTTAQSVRPKSESRPTTNPRYVRTPKTVREEALKKEKEVAAALAAKKAKQAQVAEAARRARTKLPQGGAGAGAGALTARTTSSQREKTSVALESIKKTLTTALQRGAGVLTAPPKPILRTKGSAFVLQASKKSEAPKSVVWWDKESGVVVPLSSVAQKLPLDVPEPTKENEKGSSKVDQAGSVARALSLDARDYDKGDQKGSKAPPPVAHELSLSVTDSPQEDRKGSRPPSPIDYAFFNLSDYDSRNQKEFDGGVQICGNGLGDWEYLLDVGEHMARVTRTTTGIVVEHSGMTLGMPSFGFSKDVLHSHRLENVLKEWIASDKGCLSPELTRDEFSKEVTKLGKILKIILKNQQEESSDVVHVRGDDDWEYLLDNGRQIIRTPTQILFQSGTLFWEAPSYKFGKDSKLNGFSPSADGCLSLDLKQEEFSEEVAKFGKIVKSTIGKSS